MMTGMSEAREDVRPVLTVTPRGPRHRSRGAGQRARVGHAGPVAGDQWRSRRGLHLRHVLPGAGRCRRRRCGPARTTSSPWSCPAASVERLQGATLDFVTDASGEGGLVIVNPEHPSGADAAGPGPRCLGGSVRPAGPAGGVGPRGAGQSEHRRPRRPRRPGGRGGRVGVPPPQRGLPGLWDGQGHAVPGDRGHPPRGHPRVGQHRRRHRPRRRDQPLLRAGRTQPRPVPPGTAHRWCPIRHVGVRYVAERAVAPGGGDGLAGLALGGALDPSASDWPTAARPRTSAGGPSGEPRKPRRIDVDRVDGPGPTVDEPRHRRRRPSRGTEPPEPVRHLLPRRVRSAGTDGRLRRC